MTAFDPNLIQKIRNSANIAVLVIDDAGQAVPLARALLEGGVTAMELTLRTPAALDALRTIVQEVPEMMAGVGTVLTSEQIREIAGTGAAFAVSPGLNPNVVRAAIDAGLNFAPGVMTPSEIEQAVELGCKLLKYFPAETSGGLNALKAFYSPYAHLELQFIPLGGLNPDNTGVYLRHPAVAACGGSWIAPREAIQARDWDRIRDLATQATRIAAEARPMPTA